VTLTQDLIHIATSHLLPKFKYPWVSQIETGPYHIETNASAGQGGQSFRALCGASGEFYYFLQAAQIFPSQKCKTCEELSTKGIQDLSTTNILDKAVTHESGTGVVANRKPLANTNRDTQKFYDNSITYDVAPQGVVGSATESRKSTPEAVHGLIGRSIGSTVSDVADKATGIAPDTDSPMVGDSGASTSARVDAPGYSLAVSLGSLDALIQQVEGVLVRHKVVETELAEVGQ
jgi:hypothetical protein